MGLGFQGLQELQAQYLGLVLVGQLMLVQYLGFQGLQVQRVFLGLTI